MKIRNPITPTLSGNNIKIRIPACHAELLRAEHKSTITNIVSGTILNLCTGIAGRSNDQNISGMYMIFRGSISLTEIAENTEKRYLIF